MTFAMTASPDVLARLFPEVATIERPTFGQDAEGAVEATWATLHTDVPSQFSPLPGVSRDTEVRNAAGEFVNVGVVLYLRGDYDIAETDRCITRGETFDVTSVERDSYAIVTVLHLERREPASEAFS